MWREIYLDHGGWSIAAWLGTAVVVGIIAILVAQHLVKPFFQN